MADSAARIRIVDVDFPARAFTVAAYTGARSKVGIDPELGGGVPERSGGTKR